MVIKSSVIDHTLMPYLCEHVPPVQVYAAEFHREIKQDLGKGTDAFPYMDMRKIVSV